MRLHIFLFFFLLLSNVIAEDFFLFSSKEKNKTLRARPIAIQGKAIVFERPNGKTFTALPSIFSPENARALSQWHHACLEDAHQQLIKRIKQSPLPSFLFIGNSYSFQVPGVFEALAKSEGKRLRVSSITHGAWTLADHANHNATMQAIASGKWDVVVLQEQSLVPSFLENQRAYQMYPPAKQLANAAYQAGALPVFFETWGRKGGDKGNAHAFPNDNYLDMQKRLCEGYANAAIFAGKCYVVPVGHAWASIRAQKADQDLYASDGSHPAKRGIYLAACTFYSSFFNQPVKKRAANVSQDKVLSQAAYQQGRWISPPFPLPHTTP